MCEDLLEACSKLVREAKQKFLTIPDATLPDRPSLDSPNEDDANWGKIRDTVNNRMLKTNMRKYYSIQMMNLLDRLNVFTKNGLNIIRSLAEISMNGYVIYTTLCLNSGLTL